jgi:hypothetical protein
MGVGSRESGVGNRELRELRRLRELREKRAEGAIGSDRELREKNTSCLSPMTNDQ